MDTQKITRYVLLTLLLVILFALAWWYFMLHKQTSDVASSDAARGFGEASPQASQAGSSHDNGAALVPGGATKDETVVLGNPGLTLLGTQNQGAGQGVNIELPRVGDWTTSSSSAPAGPKFKTPRVWHVEKMPVAGFGFVKSASTTAKLLLVERATGYVFSADAATGELARISNTLVPKVYDAFVAADGATILRSLDIADQPITFAATSTKTAKDGVPEPLVGAALDRNIESLTTQPGSRTIFFTEEVNGLTAGYTAAWDGTKKKQVFSSSVGSWRLYFLSDGQLVVAQKAEDAVPGYAYKIDRAGILVPLARAVPGLTILPHTVSPTLVYSTSDGTSLALYSSKADGSAPVQLPVRTVADKCVWGKGTILYCAAPVSSPGENYLRKWYTGALHTQDSWWKIDAASGVGELFLSNIPGATGADVQNPVMDPSGGFIAFRDARDQSLWLLRIAP